MAGEEERKKVKFLCSHGGRMVERAWDGQQKYVGGETRVVVVPRHIRFSELQERVSEMVEGETVLKYEIKREDILVTVKTDEDVQHMMCEAIASPKLRTFLFPQRIQRVHSSPALHRPFASASPFPNHLRHSIHYIDRAESLPLPPTTSQTETLGRHFFS